MEGTAQRRVRHQIQTRLFRTLVNQILKSSKDRSSKLCPLIPLLNTHHRKIVFQTSSWNHPCFTLYPLLFRSLTVQSRKSLALISQQSSPKLWKAALGTLSLLMSIVTSSALPAHPQRPHAARCAGSLPFPVLSCPLPQDSLASSQSQQLCLHALPAPVTPVN